MITQEELRRLLSYDALTGIFTWLIKVHPIGVGDIAGCSDNGYIVIGVGGISYKAHRLAFLYMTGKFPANQVDHINGIRKDNRWDNLRDVTGSENMRNSSIRNDNTSGIVGVVWDRTRNKWQARINVCGKRKTIGRFTNKEDAIAARKAAEIEYNYHENHGK